VVARKVSDVDSQCMALRIEHGQPRAGRLSKGLKRLHQSHRSRFMPVKAAQ
jgi:hypothetical protein